MIKKLALITILLFLPVAGFAGEVSVSPSVIDRSLQLRDDLSLQITVENNEDSNFRFYPILANIDSEEGIDFNSKGLIDWVEIDRGRFEIESGEEKIIDFSVSIPGDVEPGTYYGKLFLSQGSTPADAEDAAKEGGQPEAIIRLEVKEGIIENAQLNDFGPENDINLTSPIDFSSEIENIGNREIKPSGEVLIYNERTGREVKVMPFNEGEDVIEAESSQVIKNSWDDSGFGRYSAVLRAEYGEETTRDLQSTVYFWILPLPFVIGFIALIVALFISLIILLRKMINESG